MDDIYDKITDPSEFGIEFNEQSQIQEFYAGQTVLLTGCTGFLGKCLVEKLLRGCPDLAKLYLMVRPLKESAEERIKKYFEHIIFSKLHKLTPNFASKVVVIEGNLMEEDLGISTGDRNLIINEVTIIIHNGSNVKFDAPISKLLRTNVLGTKCLLDLAKECKKISIFTYVSTAYSHCYQQHLEERCYPPPRDLKQIQKLVDTDENFPGGIPAVDKPKLSKPWPNMYVFSKATAESLIEQCAKEVSFTCIIFRPSIVLSTYKEPIAAWTDNVNGPLPAFIGAGLGVAHATYRPYYTTDFVPADMCTNGLLSIIWDAAVNRIEKSSVLVYNYGSSTLNQINGTVFGKYVYQRGRELPSSKMFAPYFMIIVNNIFVFYVMHFFLHFIPAIVHDISLIATLRKPWSTSLFYKITANLDIFWYFSIGNWRIHVQETQKMWNRMSKIDKHLFYSDVRTLSWEDYAYNYWPGIREYLLNDPVDGDKSYMQKFAIIMTVLRISRVLLLTFILYYYQEFFLLILSPFHNLAKHLCCKL